MGFFDRLASVAAGIVASQAIRTPRLSALDLAYAERTETLLPDRQDALYALYQNYYDGRQNDPRDLDFGSADPATVTTPFRARHNFMSVVVDVLVERLSVVGFAVTGDGLSDAAAAGIAGQLWRWWQQNRMDEHQVTVHAQAAIKGDAFLLVDYDAESDRPRFTFHDATEVTPLYDAGHHMSAAYKFWVEHYTTESGQLRARRRLTKYSPDLIEKFADEGDGWTLWTADLDADGNPDGGVIAWVNGAGDPLGIPFVHFKNKPRGGDYGRSEVADAIPLQDELNRRVWATSEAASYEGSKQKYIVNGQSPKGADGKQAGWVSGPGQVWAITPAAPDKPVQVGQLDAGDVAALQDIADRELKALAGQTRTPLHLIWPEGPLPSGESLKTAEAGLVAKARDRSVTFGNAWEDACRLAIRLHNTFGTGEALPDTVMISAEWAPFETRSALGDEQVIALRRPDLSWNEAMRERGFDADTIDLISQERDAETPPALSLIDTAARQQSQQDAAARQAGG